MVTVVEKRAHNQQDILFICDFSPPRSPDPKFLEPTRQLDADFISVAYSPGRSIRVHPAFAAFWIKKNVGKEVLFTIATRDMNKVAAQSLLLGAALINLENVVIVQGDRFADKDPGETQNVTDIRPTELIRLADFMNQGLDYKGRELCPPSNFCLGATIDLRHEIEREVNLTRKKIDNGAQFFLLQSIFDPIQALEFIENYERRYGERLSTPVFCGIQVMNTNSSVFGDVPNWVHEDLQKGRSGEDIAIQVLGQFVDRGFRSIYLIPPIASNGRRDYRAAQQVIKVFKE